MRTKIEWTEYVWNPVTGCSPISPGCQNCYAARMAKRLAGRNGYPADNPFRVTMHAEKLNDPLKWKKPRRIFVCSMGDLFHDDIPNNHVAAIFGIMASAPQHTFLLLTKRPERALAFFKWVKKRGENGRACFPYDNDEWRIWHMLHVEGCRLGGHLSPHHGGRWPLPNVWLGVTAENQEQADKRIPVLLQIPAAIRFISVEPMLSAVDLREWLQPYWPECRCKIGPKDSEIYFDSPNGVPRCPLCNYALGGYPELPIHWVICGGETGLGARPMHPDWVRSLRDQCVDADVPFFFKQWGVCVFEKEITRAQKKAAWNKNGSVLFGPGNKPEDRYFRTGKKAAGNLLDGAVWNQYPGDGIKA